jgi:pimeloyl-ACP methyl ester carboxylesterase
LLTDNVSRLLLYEPPIPTGIPMYPPGSPERIDELVAAGDNEGALEAFFREVVEMPDSELVRYRQLPMWMERIKLAPTIARELAIDRRYTFEPPKFTGFDIPTTLLLGSESPPMFSSAAALVSEAVSTAEVVELPGQRHIAMDTDPDLFLEVVTSRLAA